jgi:hypothetical protein
MDFATNTGKSKGCATSPSAPTTSSRIAEIAQMGIPAVQKQYIFSGLTLQCSVGPLPPRLLGVSTANKLRRLSRKSILFPTINMESFEDSPDAECHGGYSIMR